ncbi:ribonuclease activity regulator RraA [Shimia abyssi]|uniref:Regulator of RNase E activity RraA n=1 Tax=Shimia abyssi TaxID=1662395 RepID=A0A2P8FAX8_9RHOB|nr:ribonuclease activity regulator RraA [Shimia abyssi]PSL18893.1 regulator of RNase E activity RraA [Shimia abyssi]
MPNPPDANTIAVSPDAMAQLKNASTASVATLLYKRGFHNAYIQGVAPLSTDTPTMVGPAYTLRYIPARPDTDPLDAFREPDHPQRVAVEECPRGSILVMDCRQDASAASAGSILLTRCQMRGVGGVVTDGGIRDARGAAALEMPVFAAKASAPTNLTKHHAVDIQLPISCGGVAIYPGDIIMGDSDGVMVIPRSLADEVAHETVGMEQFEAFVLEEVNSGASIRGLYPPTDPETLVRFDAWKANQSIE